MTLSTLVIECDLLVYLYLSIQPFKSFFCDKNSHNLFLTVHLFPFPVECMRENVEFQVQAAQARDEEQSLRCCYVGCSRDECGMIPLDE